jgi:type IV secretory pathway VirB10-like protein
MQITIEIICPHCHRKNVNRNGKNRTISAKGEKMIRKKFIACFVTLIIGFVFVVPTFAQGYDGAGTNNRTGTGAEPSRERPRDPREVANERENERIRQEALRLAAERQEAERKAAAQRQQQENERKAQAAYEERQRQEEEAALQREKDAADLRRQMAEAEAARGR